MFISNEEKLKIASELGLLSNHVATLRILVSSLEKRVVSLETKPVKVKKPKKVMSAEQKAKQRAYQAEYKRRVKAKLAEQLTQGTPNVSA